MQMDSLLIRGGRKLVGEIEVSGSKNIALAVLSSIVLAEEPVLLRNVPNISDTRIKTKLLEIFGAKVAPERGCGVAFVLPIFEIKSSTSGIANTANFSKRIGVVSLSLIFTSLDT